MKKVLLLTLAATVSFGTAPAQAQSDDGANKTDVAADNLMSSAELQDHVAPVALYADT